MILYVTVAFGVPVKVNADEVPEHIVVGFRETTTEGNGKTVIVTVETSVTQKAEETVYVKTYGLPANVILETFNVP